jgi:geranylgeranyl diphosphate/geranylgeranyl-bacteriochlorophyllide a reductase
MTWDIAIVGAGPAGAWAAYSLARRGARVALIDPSHPREKACGGGVTGRALALVARALYEWPLPAAVIRSARFIDSRAGRSAIVPLAAHGVDPSSALIVASRSDFDGRLLAAARAAGATLVEARVTDIGPHNGGLAIETTAGTQSARVIVGADGANSLVRRRLARAFRRDQFTIATGYFADGVTSDEIVIELLSDPPGYIWSFPRPSHLAIGICTQADGPATAGTLRVQTARWIQSTHIADGVPLRPYSWPIPSLGANDLRRLEVSGPGWALVGDAAGLVDPITREGIFFALRSAEILADALASDAPDPLARYTDQIRDEIAPELARAARLKSGFYQPRFVRHLFDALTRSRAIRDVMADLVAGKVTYAQLKWRVAQTMEIGLAWSLLGNLLSG